MPKKVFDKPKVNDQDQDIKIDMETNMTASDKAKKVDFALDQLAIEISGDRNYDNATAVLACNAIDTFMREAGEQSKALLFNILMGE